MHFGYHESLPVLSDIDLDIPAGAMVALVGPTGAGKTSIANLIARFYDVSAGSILIDGVDIREVEQRSMRAQMGLVSQDPFIFAGSIADNIRFGKPEATSAEVSARLNWPMSASLRATCRMATTLKSMKMAPTSRSGSGN